jgi:glycosyltransferase involved in cell wall biosynthesis
VASRINPKKLRIAFATPEYVTENHFDGGLANYLGRLTQSLADLGHDIHVVTLSVRALEKLQISLSPHIYAPSRNLQQIFVKKERLDRVRVIPTPMYLETRDWDYSVYDQVVKEKDYLLFFGRFEQRKGFHILAEALARVLENNEDVQAVLVGHDVTTNLYPSMAGYALSLCGKFGRRFILMDKLPHRQLYPIIAKAKLIVLPSLADNMPNACLEALALGKPVVGTWEASFDEMITDEETGFLVASNNVDALAKKIIHAWRHPKLQEIGRAAQQRVMQLSPEKTIDALLNYYREILQK